MTGKDRSNVESDTPNVKLPAAARHMTREHPELWEAFERLGEAASRAGPLEPRTRRLIHLALAIAADSEGATHSHVRRATAEGISSEELEHVAILAITPDPRVSRQLCLLWGAHSVLSEDIHSYEEMVDRAAEAALAEAFAKPAESIVVVAGIPFGEAGTTNNLRVVQISRRT